MRLGARTRIFNDLASATLTNIFGYIMTSAQGNTFQSYWLFIPSLSKAWVFNFDEANWTQILFPNTTTPAGPVESPGLLNGPTSIAFAARSLLTIHELPGIIANQFWTPLSIINGTPLDTMVIADNIHHTAAAFTFGQPSSFPTATSINATDGWYVRSGPLDFDDNRHEHVVNKVRIVLTDVAQNMRFNLRLSTIANGKVIQTPVWNVTVGTGSGSPITVIVDLRNGISGRYITWELSGPPNVAFELVEVTPYPIVAGEVQWENVPNYTISASS
jgi:hypothetical protein